MFFRFLTCLVYLRFDILCKKKKKGSQKKRVCFCHLLRKLSLTFINSLKIYKLHKRPP